MINNLSELRLNYLPRHGYSVLMSEKEKEGFYAYIFKQTEIKSKQTGEIEICEASILSLHRPNMDEFIIALDNYIKKRDGSTC